MPLAFSPLYEHPNPAPAAKPLVGYPVTVRFSLGLSVKDVRAVIWDERGREIDAWVSSPERPANRDYYGLQRNDVSVIPKSPLRPLIRYQVRVTAEVNGRVWARDWRFTTADPAAADREATERILALVNTARRGAGMKPLTLGPARSRTAATLATGTLDVLLRAQQSYHTSPHDDRKDAPPAEIESERVKVAADLSGLSPEEAVEGWLGSPLLRHLILDPGRSSAGIGSASRSGIPDQTAYVIDMTTDGNPWPVDFSVYPADGQTGVPLVYQRSEVVDRLVPSLYRAVREALRGYAVTAAFPPGARLAEVEGRLEDESGTELSSQVLWGDRFAGPDPDRFRTLVCLVPERPLKEKTRYRVRLKAAVNGKAWSHTWAFATGPAPDPDLEAKEVARRAVEALNQHRKAAGLKRVVLDPDLSRGCLLHARYLLQNQYHLWWREKLLMHEEDPELPGFTKEGRKAGAGSVITLHSSGPAQVVDCWLNCLYHRFSLLDPALERVGYSCLRTRLGKPDFIVVMDVANGLAKGSGEGKREK